jgi:saccharopine dehydrogenase-like NADP-dependent oxidoreductase
MRAMTTTRGRGRARAANATTTTTTRHRRRHRAVRARASEDANEASERTTTTTTTTTTTKVVVLGGTGRVGSATAAALVRGANGGVEVTLGGRSRERDAEAKARHRGLANASFVEVDVCDKASVTRAIQGADLVINTAGPFQRRKSCAALEAALESGVKYLDVCDDASYGAEAKKLSEKAKAAGVAAITCAGIYPGVSNLMARDIVESMKAEFRATEENEGKEPEVEYVLYNYFTAGSGGVGTTILATSYWLCGEDVVCWEDGQRIVEKPASQRKVVDFGKGVGRREVFLYNLPEVASTREIFGARTVKARFGTSPGIWNGAMVAIANLVPKSLLENQDAMKGLANFSAPIVRSVDAIVGETTSIRVDVKLKDGKQSVGLYTHPRLSECVGTCTASFATAMLNGECAPGVWYPEEVEAISDRDALFERAKEGTSLFALNQAPWMVESKPVNLGFGLYWT